MDLSDLSSWIERILEQPDVLPANTVALYVAESPDKETGESAQAFAVTPTLLVALDLECGDNGPLKMSRWVLSLTGVSSLEERREWRLSRDGTLINPDVAVTVHLKEGLGPFGDRIELPARRLTDYPRRPEASQTRVSLFSCVLEAALQT
jgi:hypothetical protein